MPEALSVLIVDDDESSREYLGVLLGELGYSTQVAAGGLAALEKLGKETPPDVVLLDVMMPAPDGMETLRRYRSAGGKAAVVMCSALDEADIVVLLHPDYQYDPKAVPLLIAPILAGHADMTFGSRFASTGDPIAGGMPSYRYVGNRLTTIAETNRGTGNVALTVRGTDDSGSTADQK